MAASLADASAYIPGVIAPGDVESPPVPNLNVLKLVPPAAIIS